MPSELRFDVVVCQVFQENKMRLIVTIASKTVEELMDYSSASSKSEAVNQAVEEWIGWKKRQNIKELRGKLDFDFDVKPLDQIEIEQYKQIKD